ncbi:MAG: lipase family protein [Sulfurovum sp.]|nr:lipase family protein [Sulfurovum sp.]
MKRYFSYMMATLSVLLFVGCGGGDLAEPENGAVTGGELVVDVDGETIKQSLITQGVPGITESSTVYGYKAYKIPYVTTDEEGNRVEVSGLMVVPTGVPDVVRQIGFSVVSDDHGTIFANSEAPTVIAETTASPDGAPVILSSLYAFVTLQPDYIGFGDSLGHYHPFVLKKSLANATVDFIKAAQTFAQNNNIPLNGQLFLTGYSEGGYAAMAALQKIEAEGGPQVTMAAPMAGPYALDLMAQGVLSQPTLSVPSFMANVGYAYAKAYNKPLTEIINEPYASRLPTLFDGTRTRLEIDPELTQTTTGTDGLFNPVFVNDFFSNPATNWFMQAVVENSVYQWQAQTPVKLVHCIGDDVIPYAISDATKQAMDDTYGSTSVEIVPVEVVLTNDPNTALRYGHSECGSYAYGVAAEIFAAVRSVTIGY